MNSPFEDLQETIEAIIQDVVLLEAMDLRMEHHNPRLSSVSPEVLDDTRQRVLDYLAQHTTDLYTLTKCETA